MALDIKMKEITLTSGEIETLLGDLCVRLGFCLPPQEQDRLIDAPPSSARVFTDAVFMAEGMNPETADRQLYKQVLLTVESAFERSKSNA